MVDFDNTAQSKKVQEIRNKEEEVFVERVSQKFGLPYIDLSGANIETDALAVLPEADARAGLVAPFKIVGKDLYIAVKSPNLNQTKSVLAELEKKYNLGVHMVSTRSLEKAWDRYGDMSHALSTQGGLLDISPEKLKELAENVKRNSDIAAEFNKVLEGDSIKKTTEFMEVIFGGAIGTKSSDIHIEAQDEQVRIRFRQDGVLQDVAEMDHESYKKLLSRIKLLSNMKLTQTKNAQDGRFTIDYDGKEIEVRVSVIPSAYGESFVMRILNPDGIKVGIENLGIEPKLFEILMQEIEKPNGMILTTGPTGSGKTTSLYSFMNKVYSPEVKILTIEDPIEYHLEGISQTQVNRQKGYTFLSGLRAALRQDPDIVMVGEIRDGETASIAVNASLTGHLVLSTLHTNSAAGVIPRLIDLGVSPQILAAALSVSIAQRLVRKVCEHCKEEVQPTEKEEATIRDILLEADRNNKNLHDYGLAIDQEIKLFKGRGCEACNGTGYKGRIGLYEAIITDDKIEELLNQKPSEQDVRKVAEKQGLLNMREDGVVKILNGITSLDEVKKVIDLNIKNITQDDSDEDSENNISSKLGKKQTIINTQEINPEAVFNTKSVEISLLIDYLRSLEDRQRIDPEHDISHQIQKVQTTILELLKHSQAEETFNESKDFAKTHKKFKGLADDLEEMHQHQLHNPGIDMSDKIRQIREEIEHHDVKTV
ncbi:MAG: type II/IV secretion system protein [Candidatus Pacebacteria bacterium]|nr:type II/IV secretion system protein [Candidatus Paceibacterota bacterium]